MSPKPMSAIYVGALNILGRLSDEELLRLHQEVSRRAHHVRMKNPELRRRWLAGMEASRGQQAGGRSIEPVGSPER